MEKENLIAKWMSGEITPNELELLKSTEDLDALRNILDQTSRFKSPDFNRDAQWEALQNKLPEKGKVVRLPLWSYAAGIAATIALLVGFFLFRTPGYHVSSGFAEQKEVRLPDASLVALNSVSDLGFDPDTWEQNRNVTLKGEAYFEVAKGKKFQVITPQGTIAVLGTKFNVKSREDYFEVRCYEGKVQVAFKDTIAILTPDRGFRVIEGVVKNIQGFDSNRPDWKGRISKFESIPYKMVLKEAERIFNVRIEAKGADLNYHFTGTLNHDDLILSLNSITKPLHLTFEIVDDQNILIYAPKGN